MSEEEKFVPEDANQWHPKEATKEQNSAEEAKKSERVIDSKEILARLSPEKFTDDEGNEREMYTFQTRSGHPVKVIFYSPEELPFSQEVVKEKQGFILGQQPKWRRNEEWESFIAEVQNASEYKFSPISPSGQIRHEAIQEEKAVFFVESNPANFLDLAFILGVEDKKLREAREKANRRIITDKTREMIDQVIAGKVLDDEGNFRQEKNYEGEAFLTLALLGNEDAKGLLSQKVKQLEEKDSKYKESWLAEMQSKVENFREEPLKLEELVAVHLTRYLPKKTNKGLEMVSTFDVTSWRAPRDTIHWALNHPVAAHLYGSWAEAPFAVIAPMEKMIECNENPTVLNTVDTFWEVSPGERLKLPNETWTVKPGEVKTGELFQRQSGNEVIYKSTAVVPEDVSALTKYLTEHGRYYLNKQIWETLTDSHQYGAFWGDYKNAVISQEEHEHFFEKLGGVLNRKDLLGPLSERSVDNVIAQAFLDGGIKEKVPLRISEKIASEIEGHLVAKIKEIAIIKQLHEMGYDNHPGGMWAWGDSWGITYQTCKLGIELGVDVTAHTNHISNRVESAFMGGFEVGPGLLTLLEVGEITPAEYRQRANHFVTDKSPELSQKTRRMLYLAGAI